MEPETLRTGREPRQCGHRPGDAKHAMIMNPLNLLTKGRAFQNLAERPGAYKILAKSGIPNFTSNKRAPTGTSCAPPPVAQPSLFEQPVVAAEAFVIDTPKAVTPPGRQVKAMESVKPAKAPQPSAPASPFAPPVKPAEKASARDTWKQTVTECKELMRRFV